MQAYFRASPVFCTRTLVGLVLATVAVAFVARDGATQESRRQESRPPQEDQQKAAVARQIQETVEELQSVRGERRRAEQQHDDRLEVIQRQIDRLHSQVEPAEEAVQTQRREISRLENEIAKQEKIASAAQAWIDLIARQAKPVAERARQRIEHAAGAQREQRLSAIDQALREFDDDQGTQKLEGVRSLLAAFGEEWLPARSVTLANESVRLEEGQRSEHAWVVELGLVAAAFVSEGGDVVGLWTGDAQDRWKLDLSQQARNQIRQLLEIVREQKPPAVIPVPVHLSPE